MNVVEKYLFSKIRIKNLKLDIEDADIRKEFDKKEELIQRYDEMLNFIKTYEAAFIKLKDLEKFLLQEIYYKETLTKELVFYYSNNFDELQKLSVYLNRKIYKLTLANIRTIIYKSKKKALETLVLLMKNSCE